ncbi:hypothetical protein D9615_001591 [Tricholomella constricta]|uniref:DUF3835 domain-containing protein n=1 Tax=Tricholomella constricta TaxID=117010 RepID=A0A8H5MAL4_9AGAR|nr:hypothetical protein D9615_001591 [Tricholomella constricta]
MNLPGSQISCLSWLCQISRTIRRQLKMSNANQGNGDNEQESQNDGTLSKLTPAVVERLTKKLSEMMGEDVIQGFEQAHNERGEFLNEEGLPIIDITEPVTNATMSGSEDAFLIDDGPLPLTTLSPPVRGRLRQQRDRILDQLEEEERLEQKREEQVDFEGRQEILRKRKEAAANEKAKLNAAKEIQKKMGKALLRNLAKEKAQDEESQVDVVVLDDVKRSSQNDKPLKKSVAFADDPQDPDSEGGSEFSSNARHNSLDWGDVTPARLRSRGRPSLLSLSDTLPMKMTVVERVPSAPPRTTTIAGPDSDDESESGSHGEQSDDGAEQYSNSDLGPALEEEEFDVDFAQHQREIALQYYEQRNKIGAAALSAMSSHSHDGDGDVKVDIPLDMPSSESEKPSISRFKATRLASSYSDATSPSTSLGASVVPASTARTLQKAIRTGKLDADERLVGGDVDSASEEENEGLQELLNLLQKGEVYNLGPDGNFIHVPISAGNVQPAAASSSSTVGKMSSDRLPPIDRPKTSRFKLSRATAGRPSDSFRPSKTDNPSSVVERSSPKTPSTMTPTVVERSLPKPTSAMATTVTEKPSQMLPAPITPAVLERRSATTANPAASPSAFPSMIVESPSFPGPTAARTAALAGTVSASSMVIESPSFGKPAVPALQTSSRPLRPPTVLSSAVRESPQFLSGNPSPAPVPPTRKLSRFMAERS